MLLLFFAVWIVFNGRITLEIALFGIAIAGLMFWFMCTFMDYSPAKERMLYRKFPLFCKYMGLLGKEIFKANLAVCKMILTRREVMEPACHCKGSHRPEDGDRQSDAGKFHHPDPRHHYCIHGRYGTAGPLP